MSHYNTIPASPQLDRLIGEQVMGWTVGNLYADEPELKIVSEHYYEHGELGLFSVDEWQPSTKIQHAWRVAEEMRLKRCHIVVASCGGCKDQTGAWGVDMVFDDRGAIGVHHDSLALAICRAAMLAITAEPSGE